MSDDEPLAQGGLYEVFVGTRDIAAAEQYWRAYGYEREAEARLEQGLAKELYGHASLARVVRLRGAGDHGADHGLVRLIEWDEFANEGLGTRGLRYAGNRWTGQFTLSVMNVANHVAAAVKAGMDVVGGDAHFIDMGRAYAHLFDGQPPKPFADPQIALREMQVFRPESRQIVMERFGYESPLLGTFADDSLLATTQIVQGCMVVASDDPEIFGFYEKLLGLKRSLDIPVSWEDAQASREVFALTEGETHWNVDLDEPRSGKGLAERRSGRIKAFRFSPKWPIEEVHQYASPGALGYSNYTWRVRDIAEAHRRAGALGGRLLSKVVEDEFGDKAFSLRAPDGYFWTLIEG